jgi:hypothetical protein
LERFAITLAHQSGATYFNKIMSWNFFTGCLFMIFAWFYMMVFTGGMPTIPSFSK